jgi:S1-C subfamily serine protease
VAAGRSELAEERLGINVEAVTADEAVEQGFEGQGVVLSRVARGSAAERRGVAAYLGNKLVRINEHPIETPIDVRDALSGVAAGQIVSLHFMHPTLGERVVNVRMP